MRRSNARPSASDDPDPSPATRTSSMAAPPPKPLLGPSVLSKISTFPGPKRGRRLWFLLATAAAMAVLVYFFSVSRGLFSEKFGIIIDGGSTGTRVHVFGYAVRRGAVPLLDLGLTASMKVTPGLSAYSGDPEKAGESLVELLEFGRRRVPEDQWKDTEVRLMATAGLRLLDAGVAERILDSCRRTLRLSRFRFRDDWAIVISGLDEGIYAWVAANYALGSLGGDPRKTTGIVELGGASVQVTFVSSESVPTEFSHVLKFGKTTYNLYSHSFLHHGQNVAHESLRGLLSSRGLKSSGNFMQETIFRDPCAPKGYVHGVESLKLHADILDPKSEYHYVLQSYGNFSECRSAALMLLQKDKDKCLYQHCLLGSTFIPKLQGRFLATENFYYTSKFFGLGPTSVLSDLVLAGEWFCGEDWLTLKRKYHSLDEEDLLHYCFSLAYIVALLHDVLGFAMDDRRIKFANQVGDIPLDWALGALVMQKTSKQSVEHPDWISAIIGNDLSLLPFFMFTVLIFTGCSMLKWRKPQLKTIYDLDKGRYLIARVSR